MPAAPRDVIEQVTADVLETQAPATVALTRHGRAALRRRFVRAFVFAAIVIALAVLLWLTAGWSVWVPVILAAVLVPLSVFLALDRYRSLGHALIDGYLVTRRGSAIRRRYMLECDGIIGWTEVQTFWQRRSGVATLVATTAAGRGGYRIQDVDPATGIALADRATPGLLTPFRAS
jgi:putative membrane protein